MLEEEAEVQKMFVARWPAMMDGTVPCQNFLIWFIEVDGPGQELQGSRPRRDDVIVAVGKLPKARRDWNLQPNGWLQV
ncbi:hypothetical protein VTK26DRAFT_7224 [Humicola hyalothermophila]